MPEVKVKRKPRCVLLWNPQNFMQNVFFFSSFVFYISPVNDQKTDQTCREPMLVSRPCFYIMTIKLLLKLWCIPWYRCSKVGYRKIILNRNQILSLDCDARSGCKMNLVAVTELTFQPWEFHMNLRWYKDPEMLENRRQIKKYTPVYFERLYHKERLQCALIIKNLLIVHVWLLSYRICRTVDRLWGCHRDIHYFAKSENIYICKSPREFQGGVLTHLSGVYLVPFADVKMAMCRCNIKLPLGLK